MGKAAELSRHFISRVVVTLINRVAHTTKRISRHRASIAHPLSHVESALNVVAPVVITASVGAVGALSITL